MTLMWPLLVLAGRVFRPAFGFVLGCTSLFFNPLHASPSLVLGEAFVAYEGDVLDAASLAAAVRDADAVVHLAAVSSVADSFGDVAEVWRTNVLGTVNVVEATPVL